MENKDRLLPDGLIIERSDLMPVERFFLLYSLLRYVGGSQIEEFPGGYIVHNFPRSGYERDVAPYAQYWLGPVNIDATRTTLPRTIIEAVERWNRCFG